MICKNNLEFISALTLGGTQTNCILQSYCRPSVSLSTPRHDRPSVRYSKFASNETHGIAISQASHAVSSPAPTARLPVAYSPASPRNASTMISDPTEYPSDLERQRDINEEQSGAEISFAARGKGNTGSGMPFYTGTYNLCPFKRILFDFSKLNFILGENPGVTSIINVSSESQQAMPRHILLNPAPTVSISQVDHDYLRRKGALTLLENFSRKEILRAYFHHVHTILPVLDLSKLPELENITASPSSNMLLFWAMAVAAVNVGKANTPL
jgi:hypothetical protein